MTRPEGFMDRLEGGRMGLGRESKNIREPPLISWTDPDADLWPAASASLPLDELLVYCCEMHSVGECVHDRVRVFL
jgi:hypothetical protein